MEWFKLYNRVFDSPTLMTWPDSLCWKFIGLLCLASKSDRGGVLAYRDAELARYLRMSERKWLESRERLLEDDMLAGESGNYRVVEWDRYQGTTSKHRTRRWRARRRAEGEGGDGDPEASGDATETSRERHRDRERREEKTREDAPDSGETQAMLAQWQTGTEKGDSDASA